MRSQVASCQDSDALQAADAEGGWSRSLGWAAAPRRGWAAAPHVRGEGTGRNGTGCSSKHVRLLNACAQAKTESLEI